MGFVDRGEAVRRRRHFLNSMGLEGTYRDISIPDVRGLCLIFAYKFGVADVPLICIELVCSEVPTVL